MISAVGVAIPARDEAQLIGGCLRHLGRALAQLPARVTPAVCVVADRCGDATADVARAAFGGWRHALVRPNDGPATIGELRDLGFREVRAALRGQLAAETLLLSTDADTMVDPNWALAHLRLAERGWHAVAGEAELAQPLPPHVALRYAAVRERTPPNVYGANLGVRADAYTAIGGFAPLPTGEDQDLWQRLGAAGFRLTGATEPVVHTSARRHGRAGGGVAALLRDLHEDGLATAS